MTKKDICITQGITYPTLRRWVKLLLDHKPELFEWERFSRCRVLPPDIEKHLKNELCIQL